MPSFVPPVSSPGDDSNFEMYDEEDLVVGEEELFAKEFANF